MPPEHNARVGDSEFADFAIDEFGGEFGPGGVPWPANQPDDELLQLTMPARPARWMTIGLMSLVVALAFGLVTTLVPDIGYFFSSDRAVDLGDVRALDSADLGSNRYVRIEGTPMVSRMVEYSRVLTGSNYVVFPLAGQRTVFVQVPAGPGGLPNHFSRREFSGRLVTFDALGSRFSAVAEHIQRSYPEDVSGASYVIMADEPPGSYGWALMLSGLCALFVLLNLMLLIRWFRPLPYATRD